jgi:hypothetical protein
LPPSNKQRTIFNQKYVNKSRAALAAASRITLTRHTVVVKSAASASEADAFLMQKLPPSGKQRSIFNQKYANKS